MLYWGRRRTGEDTRVLLYTADPAEKKYCMLNEEIEYMRETPEPLWDRTLRRIREIWPLGDLELKDMVGPSFPESDFGKVRAKIDACLDSLGGEVSARARAAELGEAYSVLNAEGRKRFLELLAREYDVG